MRLLLLSAAAGLVLLVSGVHAGEPIASPFPILGGEYVFKATCRILPEGACGDGHIVFLAHGFGSWFRVAYSVPSVLSWKPPETAEVWINLEHVVRLEQVPEDGRLIRVALEP